MSHGPSQTDRHIVQRLLEAARSGSRAGAAKDAGRVEAADYDWTAPCRFVPAQLAKLDAFAEALAASLSQALGGLMGGELEFVPAGRTQHFAAGLRASAEGDQAKEYWVELLHDETQCGLIAVSAGAAMGWVARLLGSKESAPNVERDLSALESALLLDVLAAMTEAFSVAAEAGGAAFSRGETVSKGSYSLPGDEGTEYCRIALAPAGEGQAASISFVVASDALEPLAGGRPQSPARSSRDVSKDVLALLERASMVATGMLGTAELPMREVMALEAGDVLLIAKRTGEPIDLVVQGRVVSRALPVTSGGRYALQIVEGPRRTTRATPQP